MSRPWNFSAGPSVLPVEVLQTAANDMLDWHGSGMSVMEMSHRGKQFMQIYQQAEADFVPCWGCRKTTLSCSPRVVPLGKTPSCP